jgi:hypothetical protein
MHTNITLICVGVVGFVNLCIGLYVGVRGIQGFARPGFGAFLISGLGTAAILLLVHVQKNYGVVVQLNHVFICLAFLPVGLLVGRCFRGSVGLAALPIIPWEQLGPALSRHTGKKIHVTYQLRVDGPNTAARLVCETLERVGLVMSRAGADHEPSPRTESVPDAELILWVYGQGVDSAGNATTVCYVVMHPKRGTRSSHTVADPRKLTASIMTSIYKCLEDGSGSVSEAQGVELAQQGQYAAARHIFQEVLSTKTVPLHRGQVLRNIGLTYEREGNKDEAIRVYQEILAVPGLCDTIEGVYLHGQIRGHGHQLESILSYVNQRQDGNTQLFWDRFCGRTNGVFQPGRCGNTHFPPNGTGDYDYNNITPVLSDCMDWTPDKTGQLTAVNANTWGLLPYAWPGGNLPQKTESQYYIF